MVRRPYFCRSSYEPARTKNKANVIQKVGLGRDEWVCEAHFLAHKLNRVSCACIGIIFSLLVKGLFLTFENGLV